MHPLSSFCYGFSSLRIDSISLDGLSDHIHLRGAYAQNGKLIAWRCRMQFRVLNEVLMEHVSNEQRQAICEALSDILIAGRSALEEINVRRCLGCDLVLEQVLLLSALGQDKSRNNPLIDKVSRIRKK